MVAVDGSSLPSVHQETILAALVVEQHYEEISWDVVDIVDHDFVLGIPWLRQHNPDIDWETGVLTFQKCGCATGIGPTQGRRSLVDEIRQFNEI